MNKKIKIISITLVTLSVLCAIAGLVFLLGDNLKIVPVGENFSGDSSKIVSEEPQAPEAVTDTKKDKPEASVQESKEDTTEETEPAHEEQAGEEPTEEEQALAMLPELLPVTGEIKEAVENPYKDYYLQNEDMVGWLKIPDTIVDFPVMQTPWDENYYLLKGFDKKYSGNGCLILDTDSSMYPLTTNLIIHGHNNKNAMFGKLFDYTEKDYRDLHPYIYLYGKDYEHIYEVMAVFRSQVFYTTDTCFKYYKFFTAETEEEFNDFIDNVKALELYDSGVTAEFGDRLLTLSTCSSHIENGRFVVVAVEREPGDTYIPIE